jgi:hypothetical protein
LSPISFALTKATCLSLVVMTMRQYGFSNTPYDVSCCDGLVAHLVPSRRVMAGAAGLFGMLAGRTGHCFSNFATKTIGGPKTEFPDGWREPAPPEGTRMTRAWPDVCPPALRRSQAAASEALNQLPETANVP